MSKLEAEKNLAASVDQVLKVLTEFEKYPEFIPGCKKVTVEKGSNGKSVITCYQGIGPVTVPFKISITVDQKQGIVQAELMDKNYFNKLSKEWSIQKTKDGKTSLKVKSEIESKFPDPLNLMAASQKDVLPKMLDLVEWRVNNIN